MNMWTVFANEHEIMKADEMLWVTELNFYKGDLRSIDLAGDWRFKEVPKKRSQAKLLGLYSGHFPIEYPLQLTDGTIIQSDDYYHPTPSFDTE